VQEFAFIEADDVVGDVGPGFSMIDILPSPAPFHFKVYEEALRDGVDASMSRSLLGCGQLSAKQRKYFSDDISLETAMDFLVGDAFGDARRT
jgi:hypothetical protein